MLSFLKIVTAIVLALSSIPALRATNLCGAQASVCTTVAQLQSCVQGSGYTCQISNAGALQVSSTINVTGTNILIEGQGAGSTLSVLQRSTSSLLTILSLGSSASGITIQSLVFDGNNNLWSWCTNKPSCNGSGDHNNEGGPSCQDHFSSAISNDSAGPSFSNIYSCQVTVAPFNNRRALCSATSLAFSTLGQTPAPVTLCAPSPL